MIVDILWQTATFEIPAPSLLTEVSAGIAMVMIGATIGGGFALLLDRVMPSRPVFMKTVVAGLVPVIGLGTLLVWIDSAAQFPGVEKPAFLTASGCVSLLAFVCASFASARLALIRREGGR